MKKKLLFICSPGLGILDNALPILYILKEKYELDIIFLKKDIVKHFAKNLVLDKLSHTYRVSGTKRSSEFAKRFLLLLNRFRVG